MKIGILTYHRAENYGALLQSYALLSFLRSLGHDVSFVDYWPEYHKDYFRILPHRRFRQVGVKHKALILYQAIVWGLPRLKRKRVLKHFMYTHLGVAHSAEYSSENEICSEFDVVVYGSDQIWRQQKLPGHSGVDYWYYGSENVRARKIAYAASMGASELAEEEKQKVRQLLNGFEALSVRESSLHDFLDLMGYSSSIVVDPVFLLTAEQWRKLYRSELLSNTRKQKYILFYNLLNSPVSSSFAEKLSKLHNLPIVEITKKYGIKQLGGRYVQSASVPEFLSLVDNAEYVVSNSFHGVAMSIIFEKQFFAVGMGNKADRVQSLLQAFHIEERFINEIATVSEDMIDYTVLQNKREKYIQESKIFLKNHVGSKSFF